MRLKPAMALAPCLLVTMSGLGAAPVADAPMVTTAEASSPAYQMRTVRNRAAFLDFVHLYYERHEIRPAFETYVARDYVQHNPEIANGREAAISWLEKKMARSTLRMDLRRVLVDGDYAVVHLLASQGPDDPGHAIMNIFRLRDGQIVEHWDVTQPIPANTASGNEMG